MIMPQNLKEAFNKARNRSRVIGADDGYLQIKDFISQKFTAAYLRAESDGELKRLQMLWKNITKELDDNNVRK